MVDIQSYDYIVLPYPRVRDALLHDAAPFLAGTLHAGVGPFDIGVNIAITVTGAREERSARGDLETQVGLVWTAASHPGLFPVMEATLRVYALSAHETQLELIGQYRPPGSVAGAALDAAVGHRVAMAAITRFLGDVRERLLTGLGGKPA